MPLADRADITVVQRAKIVYKLARVYHTERNVSDGAYLAQANNRKSAPMGMVGNVFLVGKSASIFMPKCVQSTTEKIV
ncbi:hypothetical protein ABR965_06620 [Photorhabdus laumondii]|uniref:hypothetical protein n=1 Tax=Photorhabdus laumondii TaxID=2218628 RepID=UPI003314DDE7